MPSGLSGSLPTRPDRTPPKKPPPPAAPPPAEAAAVSSTALACALVAAVRFSLALISSRSAAMVRCGSPSRAASASRSVDASRRRFASWSLTVSPTASARTSRRCSSAAVSCWLATVTSAFANPSPLVISLACKVCRLASARAALASLGSVKAPSATATRVEIASACRRADSCTAAARSICGSWPGLTVVKAASGSLFRLAMRSSSSACLCRSLFSPPSACLTRSTSSAEIPVAALICALVSCRFCSANPVTNDVRRLVASSSLRSTSWRSSSWLKAFASARFSTLGVTPSEFSSATAARAMSS